MSPNADSAPSSSSGRIVMERRAWVRYACNFPTSCQPIASERDAGWVARALNVSRGGLNLVSSRRFEVGTLLHIEIEHARDPAPSTLLARVAHVTRKDNTLWNMGCAFHTLLSEEEVQALLQSTAPED
jgi:hypothetical protein